MATLLPPGKQQFIDANGSPLAGGSVAFYIPGTFTPKNTWQDSGQVTLNTNPVSLDASGEAIIYGSGIYRQVVSDSAGNQIWDQLTSSTDSGAFSWGGTSGGSANAQTVTASSFSQQDGEQIGFIAGFTNTTAMTLNPGGGAIPVLLDGQAGPTSLSGGEVVAGNEVSLVYDSTRGALHLVNPASGVINSGTIKNTTIILKQSASPAPTTEGDIQWDTDDDQIAIGAGSATTVTFTNDQKRTARILLSNNVSISATVGAGALAITLNGANGSTPSAANPVSVPFRSATAATGTPSVLSAVAATSLPISSGSTMGASSGVAFRLWLVAFNDAGTFRLGLVNALSGTSIMALREGIYSSTAEGGAGGADSAQVIYTGTAVSSKAMTILGYLEWATGLSAAGTWDATPTIAAVWQPGVPLPGDLVQTRRNDTGAVNSGSTAIPDDDTIPQITEGNEFMTQAIAPNSAANLLRILASAELATSSTDNIVAALFRDATANALAVSWSNSSPDGTSLPMAINYVVLAASTTSTTLRIRGGSAGGTTTFNGSGGSRKYGGVLNSYLEIDEIMA